LLRGQFRDFPRSRSSTRFRGSLIHDSTLG
jgi:hypothetical protein